MNTNNSHNFESTFNVEGLNRALELLSARLMENEADAIEIVVCGGSALIVLGLVPRTTKDVDIVAIVKEGVFRSADPLPDDLLIASKEVAEDLGLPPTWLNNGPSRSEGGLLRMGLPEGLSQRLHSREYGSHLRVHFIDRFDQIHFKLYAGVDRGGYHLDDLRALSPTPEELEAAGRWAMSHDVSSAFAALLKSLLRGLGYGNVAERL